MRALPFSLIELLVVIGIISILASLLLPALAKARDSAKTIVCASNLKQIALGILNYAQSHDGYLPPHQGVSNIDEGNYWDRHLQIQGYLGSATPRLQLTKATGKVLTCPADKAPSLCTDDSVSTLLSYGLNNAVCGEPPFDKGPPYNGTTSKYGENPYMLSQLSQLAKGAEGTVVAADMSNNTNGDHGNHSILYWDTSSDRPFTSDDNTPCQYYVNARHGLGANFLFGDMHVKWIKGPLWDYR